MAEEDKNETQSKQEVVTGQKVLSKYDLVKVRVWRNDHFFVLSRFLLSNHLTATKLSNKEAIKIALAAKKQIVEQDKLDITKEELDELLFKMLSTYKCGDIYIKRYKMMGQFYEKRVPLLVLVTGCPVIGKSRLVTQLAQLVNIPNILQTDIVLEVMNNMIGGDCEPFWKSKNDFFQEYKRECLLARKGVNTDVHKCLVDGKPLIIEGYQIDPSLYLKVDETNSQKFKMIIPPSEEDENQIESKIRQTFEKINQSSAVIVGFLLTINRNDHSYCIENWMKSQDQNLALQYLNQFQEIQNYLLQYSHLLYEVDINIHDFETTLNIMHSHILQKIEEASARGDF